jgi:hypothetical protein
MSRVTRATLSRRHDVLMSRLCDLAYRARTYTNATQDSERMSQLRQLGEAALAYSAAVRTLARSRP